MNRRTAPTPFAVALAALATSLAAQAADPAVPTVVITGSVKDRVVGDAPYAISVVDRDELRSGGALVNLSESLARVPGLVVANRSNYAQDLQISSRGFGARAGFGVRGIRLLTDGIPATGPDGQGQVSQFDLAGAERVEVLRGPFSVLYGNSSGGVISLVTAPVKRTEAEGGIDIGSAGFQQLRAGIAAPLEGGFSLRVSASEMKTTGFRPRSAAQRELGNVRLGWQGNQDSVTLLANFYRQPAQDPLGLARDQFNADPLQTTPQATQFNTRKESAQDQLGATWKHRFDGGALRDVQLMGYRGQRSVTQFLAITSNTQTAAKHGGGVVNFDRDYQGAELRARFAWDGVDLMAGAALDSQTDARRGYLNYTGTVAAPSYGVIGTLRRDETNKARSSDVFAQGEVALGAGLTASAGLRSGRVKLSAEDHFLSNGDDSGAMSFSYTNPVLGLRWQAAPGWQVHASVARGFESPTLGDVAYRADGTGGLNTALQAQKSRQAELGSKWRGTSSSPWEADVALFQAKVSDEIGVATNSGGRSAFQNVGRTLRRGVEFAGGWLPASGLRARASMTLLNATYEDSFLTCAGIPCLAPTLAVPAGNRVAGTQRRAGFAEVGWRMAGYGELAAELRGAGRTAVNDANTDFAGGYAVAALRLSHVLVSTDATRVDVLLRVDNVFDRRYAGSVIVNDANGRYFETGAPRAYLLALRISAAK